MIIRHNRFLKVNNRNIYNALYSTLLYLKPKYCLEIGTFHGQSAEVFDAYFNDFQPEGFLITIDIKKYVNIDSRYIKQVIVHPHVTNSTSWHFVTNEEILPCLNNSVEENIKIIKNNFGHKFDFCFLDGDHQMTSVISDFEIANALLQDPKYILFDDIDVKEHDSMKYYNKTINVNNELNIYNFNDWYEWVGAALLWEKNK